MDAGTVDGYIGADIPAFILRRLKKDGMWPLQGNLDRYSEDDLFDMIEFLFDHVSKPVDGRFHSYNECGWHYETFDKAAGQKEFRIEVNGVLAEYASGYELSAEGEILHLADPGLQRMLDAQVPSFDALNVTKRVEVAIRNYRRHSSSLEDHRNAVRDLADVLEFLRPQLKQVLMTKDENDLFNIANNFGIRHHNERQKTEYDQTVWRNWMFYVYLATIHAAVRLIEKKESPG